MFEVEADKTTPSGLAFTGNPILVSEAMNYAGQPVTGYPLTVKLDGREVYSGRYSYPFCVDVAPVLDAFVAPLADADKATIIDCYDPFLLVDDADGMQARKALVVFDGEFPVELGFFAIPGGVSGQNLTRVSGPKSDIFTERFLRGDRNFFLTTRTAEWRIVIRETELTPLYMICGDDNEPITIRPLAFDDEAVTVKLDRGIYCLDVERFRRGLFFNRGVLANAFNIERAGVVACQIVVEAGAPAFERYRLKYRNSLGVFDIIEAAGELEVSRAMDGEVETYGVFQTASGRFSKRRQRGAVSTVYTLQTGVKLPREFAALADMLASDEVYLLDAGPLPLRVLPACEEFAYAHRQKGPQSFALSLELVDTEERPTPDIVDGASFRRPRVFSDEFSKQFN